MADYNAGDRGEGVDYTQYNALPNTRHDAFTSCIEPILEQCPNLTVVSEVLVRRVVIEGGRAVGVEVEIMAEGADRARSLCTTARPLHSRFANTLIFGASNFLKRPCDRTPQGPDHGAVLTVSASKEVI